MARKYSAEYRNLEPYITETARAIAEAVVRANLKAPTNKTTTVQGNAGKPYATVTVAANDSRAVDKASADFVCTGTADDVLISQAIARGGRVVLLDGTFTLAAPITLESNRAIVGMGPDVTTIHYVGDAAFSGDALEHVQISDLTLDGGWIAVTTSATDIDISRVEFLINVVGISLIAPNGCVVSDCRFLGGMTGIVGIVFS